MPRNQALKLAVVILALGCSVVGVADDWPEWLGPNRESKWNESGVVNSIPSDGLPVKWRAEIGLGYSGPAVVGSRVYVLDYVKESGEIKNSPGGRAALTGTERTVCLDAETGEIVWKHQRTQPYSLSYPSGPRATPTVRDGRVYSLGAEGFLACLNAETGKEIWVRNLVEDYKTQTPIWGFSAHPLVDGNTLYCTVGGEGSVVVAFDKDTGVEKWKALSASTQGYCPPTLIEHDGVRQLIVWTPIELHSLNPKSGEVYWTQELKPDYEMSVTMPRLSGNLLFASGIGRVGAAFRLGTDKSGPTAEVAWRGAPKNAFYSCNVTPIVDGGVMYGVDCGLGAMVAAKIDSGERLWESFEPTTGGKRRASHGTSYIVKHANGCFLFSETGDLILADLSPDGYQERGRFHVLEPTNECFGRKVVWAHPAFANRCMYARNDKEIVCVDLSAN